MLFLHKQKELQLKPLFGRNTLKLDMQLQNFVLNLMFQELLFDLVIADGVKSIFVSNCSTEKIRKRKMENYSQAILFILFFNRECGFCSGKPIILKQNVKIKQNVEILLNDALENTKNFDMYVCTKVCSKMLQCMASFTQCIFF